MIASALVRSSWPAILPLSASKLAMPVRSRSPAPIGAAGQASTSLPGPIRHAVTASVRESTNETSSNSPLQESKEASTPATEAESRRFADRCAHCGVIGTASGVV
jgi:hypothetical protein